MSEMDTHIDNSSALVLQPEGEGKYVWADQSIYEGGWKVCTAVQDLAPSP